MRLLIKWKEFIMKGDPNQIKKKWLGNPDQIKKSGCQ